MTVVPPRTCSYLGRHAQSLNDEHSETLVQQLDAIIQQNPPEQDASANYHEYIKSILHEAWSRPPWRDHLENLFGQTEGMCHDPDYLAAFLPSVIRLFRVAPESRTGQFIESLFDNAIGTPDAYVTLHAVIAGRWPTTDAPIGDYAPDTLAEGACQFIEEQPDREDLGDVLGSLMRLSERGLTTDTTDSRIGSVMPIVWRVSYRCLTDNVGYVSKVLEPSYTADILNGDQPHDLNQEDLAAFLKRVVAEYDADDCFNVLEATLGQQPSTLFDTPDGALGQWFTAAGDKGDIIARRGAR